MFDRRYTHMVEEQLDIEAMRRAAGYLLGTHDFKAFTSNKRSKKSTIRTIDEIEIERNTGMSMALWESRTKFLLPTEETDFCIIWSAS